MANDVMEFGIGEDDERIGSTSKKWSAEKRTYRLGFANWASVKDNHKALEESLKALLKDMTSTDEMSPVTPKFIGAQRYYKPGVGYVLHKGPEYSDLFGESPKTYVATIIIEWPSDEKGNVTKDHMARLPKVVPWVFAKGRYQEIAAAHGQFPFGDHDLMVNCTDPQYQKMTFLPAKASLFRMFIQRALGDEVLEKEFGMTIKGDKKAPDKKAQEICQYILDTAKQVLRDLPDQIGKDLSIADIRQKLSGGSGSPVGGRNSAESAEDQQEIDNLLGDILE